jgi:hypothetical protein
MSDIESSPPNVGSDGNPPADLSARPQRSQRIDYHFLNDGSDEEAPSEHRVIKKPRLIPPPASSELIGPEDSASQLMPNLPTPDSYSELLTTGSSETNQFSNPPPQSRIKQQNQWLWKQFHISPLHGKQWQPKRSRKILEDREIRCIRCDWKTTDSARATSTTNMKAHLVKHGISRERCDEHDEEIPGRIRQQSIVSMLNKKMELDVTSLMERNLIRWIVMDDMAFTAIESPVFQQIFKDLPGVTLPFSCRKTVVRRIDAEFDLSRAQLIEELAQTSSTIALSLDVWTSKNSKAILAVIGHWLTADFEYKERVLEFAELWGIHSGENMAQLVQKMLTELQIEHKLLTITADNASNNETLVSELYFNLTDKLSAAGNAPADKGHLRFLGIDSYIRCLAHVLHLIASNILSELKAGDHKTANEMCDLLQENKKIGRHSALARLRILVLWIARTPQRRQQWKVTCQTHGLDDKFIEYDVQNRWNSTYRMLKDALQAKTQIKKWIENQNCLPPFTPEDWSHLQQIENLLSKLDEFTQLVSRRQPQISLAIPLYYELHDMLDDAASAQGEFSGLNPEISSAVSAGMKKYRKYYDLMDAQDAYYIALILDPRFKTLLLEKELGDDAAIEVTTSIKEQLHEQYPSKPDQDSSAQKEQNTKPQSIEARVLQKLQPQKKQRSDIDRYFEEDMVTVHGLVTKEKDWLFSWWRMHRDEYPRMAAAARDYLAIPASEVAVERLFNCGRDLLGVRRYSLNAETMRRVMLLRDAYKSVAPL